MSEKRTINWSPSCFIKAARAAVPAKKGKPAIPAAPEVVLYQGHLIVEVPLSEDRCELLIELGVKEVKEEGNEENTDLGRASTEALDVYRRYAKKLLVGSEVVRVKDNKKLSLEEVLSEPELLMLPVQMGWKYISGFSPGNE